jgi:transcriptional regulator with XRE-family HTH domain
MAAMETTAQRLDRLMDARRLELGLRWKRLADDAGISQQTMLQLRKGHTVSDLTITRAERALEWAPGSISAILDGGDPTPLREDKPETNETITVHWDGELTGPTDPLETGEILRWRQTDAGREYKLTAGDVSVEYTFEPDETPEDVIEDLRDLLEPHRVAVEQLKRRRARR